jgi:hypothetical protein
MIALHPQERTNPRKFQVVALHLTYYGQDLA